MKTNSVNPEGIIQKLNEIMEDNLWGWDISFDLPIYYSEVKDQLNSLKKLIKFGGIENGNNR